MKNILTLLVLGFLMVGCAPKDLPTIKEIKSDYALVKISHQTTKKELLEIQQELLDVANIGFNFSKSTFLEDGQIQNLAFIVSLPDASRGAATADLLKLQFNYAGFKYDPNGNPSLNIGIF